MKIYTKTGDKGKTSLFSGERVDKNHIRIESYGTIDELNAYLGLLMANIPFDEPLLNLIQNHLFTIGSHLAVSETNSNALEKLPILDNQLILELEERIDFIQAELPPQKYFFLPQGNSVIAYAHISRTVCRRAERICVHLNSIEPINPLIVEFLNRLSDYLFVFGRFIASKMNVKEIPWVPNKKS